MGCNPSALTQSARGSPGISKATNGECTTPPRSRSWAARSSASVTNPVGFSDKLDFQNDGHDHRPARRDFLNVAFEIETDLLFHHAVVSLLFRRGLIQGAVDDLARLIAERDLTRHKAAGDDFRSALNLAGALVDGDDGEHEAVLAQVLAVANHQVFDYIRSGAGIYANPAGRLFACLDGGGGIHFENVAIFQQQRLLDHSGVLGQLHVFLQMTI